MGVLKASEARSERCPKLRIFEPVFAVFEDPLGEGYPGAFSPNGVGMPKKDPAVCRVEKSLVEERRGGQRDLAPARKFGASPKCIGDYGWKFR